MAETQVQTAAETAVAAKRIINSELKIEEFAAGEGHYAFENTFHFRNTAKLDDNNEQVIGEDGKPVTYKPDSVRVLIPAPTADSIVALIGANESIAKYVRALIEADLVANVKEQVEELMAQAVEPTQDRIDLAKLALDVVANNYFATSSRGISDEEIEAGAKIVAEWLQGKGLEQKKAEGIVASFKTKGAKQASDKETLAKLAALFDKVASETSLAATAPKWHQSVVSGLKKRMESKPVDLLAGLAL